MDIWIHEPGYAPLIRTNIMDSTKHGRVNINLRRQHSEQKNIALLNSTKFEHTIRVSVEIAMSKQVLGIKHIQCNHYELQVHDGVPCRVPVSMTEHILKPQLSVTA